MKTEDDPLALAIAKARLAPGAASQLMQMWHHELKGLPAEIVADVVEARLGKAEYQRFLAPAETPAPESPAEQQPAPESWLMRIERERREGIPAGWEARGLGPHADAPPLKPPATVQASAPAAETPPRQPTEHPAVAHYREQLAATSAMPESYSARGLKPLKPIDPSQYLNIRR